MNEGIPGARDAQPGYRLPGIPVLVGVYALYAAVVLRTLANPNLQDRLVIYLSLEFLFLVLFSLFLWKPPRNTAWRHLYLLAQAANILFLLSLRPQFDFINVLFVLLTFQAVLLFPGKTRWAWVAILVLLMGSSLMIGLGPLRGLSLALMPMAISIVFPAYVSTTQEIEARLRLNQALLAELQATNQQLQQSIQQAEELAAIQERMRLARALHDSVSQTIFGITLQTRAAQLLLEREPERLRVQLEQLQAITQGALEEMRSLIAQLRPREDAAGHTP